MNANPPGNKDDESEVDPEEVESASERIPEPATPPEISAATEDLTEWDTPTDAAGTAAQKVLPEDEVTASEELVEEGLEEADRDQRMAASDPDFEP